MFMPLSKALFICSIILLGGCSKNEKELNNYDLVLHNAVVLDVKSGGFSQPLNIAINDQEIVSISKDTLVGLNEIDVAGQFLLPAFTDAHVHLTFIKKISEIANDQDFLTYYDANLSKFNLEIIKSGVTTIIDPAGMTPFIFDIRESLLASDHIAPTIFTVGKVIANTNSRFGEIICQGSSWCKQHLLLEVDSPENAVDKLNELMTHKVDGIKIVYDSSYSEPLGTFNRLSNEIVSEVINYGDSFNLPVVSHTIANAEFKTLSLLGINGFIHSPFPENNSFEVDGTNLSQLLSSSDIPLVSTAHAFDPMSHPVSERDAFVRSVRQEIAPLMRESLDSQVKYTFGTDFSDFSEALYADIFQREIRALTLLSFTPIEIIQTLTINAGEYPIIKNKQGRVEVGFKADLLVFEVNPLSDLTLLNQPKMVIQNGKLVYTKAE